MNNWSVIYPSTPYRAGVGRSGTYICIDILLTKLQHEKSVDVYGVVCMMRTQRCQMVQTEVRIYTFSAMLYPKMTK